MNLKKFSELFITNNKTQFSYRSYLMINNMTNKDNGEYLCTIPESNELNSVTILYPVTVKS